MEQDIRLPSTGKDKAITGMLQPDVAGKIRTKRNIIIDEWADIFLMAFGMVVGLGLAPLCEHIKPSEWKNILGFSLLFGGLGFSFFAWIAHIGSPSLLPNLLLRRVARRQIKRRSDRIVDPGDPEARFVEEIPEKRCTEPSLRGATEVGFLKVDRQEGMVLFEGDKMRYWIPAKYIISCRQESSTEREAWTGGAGQTTYTKVQHFFVVISVRGEYQPRDAWFRILPGRGVFTKKQRAAANLALLHEIHQLQKASPNAQ
jgi:hypothetical protein